MKPNFALSLTYEGIELLQRAAGGWLSVGAVPFDRPDLDTAIEALRQRALALAPDGLTTKLIVPDSEVRFATVLAPGPTDEARRYQIEAEIEGLTPYPLSDLAYDWSVEGDHAQVAIVARETLREAEDFATERGFNPLSFVALPGSGQFLGEPFFGQTGAAASLVQGGMVQPDADPVRILGKAPDPVAKAPAPPKPTAPAAPAPASDPAKSVGAPAAAAPPASSSATAAAAAPLVAPPAIPPVAAQVKGATSKTPAPAAPPVPPAAEPPAADPQPAAEPGDSTGKLGDLVRRMGTAMRREQARAETPAAAEAGAAKGGATAPDTPRSDGEVQSTSADSASARSEAAVVSFTSRRTASGPAALPGVPAAPDTGAAGTPGGRLAILPRQGQGAAMSPGLAQRLNRNSRRVARQTLGKLGLLATVRRALGRGIFDGASAGKTAGTTALTSATALGAGAAAAARPAMPASLAAALAARPAGDGASAARQSPAVTPTAVPWVRPADGAAPAARLATATAPDAAMATPSSLADRAALSEAEALTLFGRRGMPQPEPLLPARTMMAVGAVLLVLVAVAVWALYFNRPGTTPAGLAQVTGVVSDPVAALPSGDAPIAAPAVLPPPPVAPAQTELTQTELTQTEPAQTDSTQTAALPEPVPETLPEALSEQAAAVTDPAPVEAAALPDPVPPAPQAAPDQAAPSDPDAIASDPDARLEELVREALAEAQPAEVLDSLPAAEQAAAETAAEPAADPAATVAEAVGGEVAQPSESLQPEVTTEASGLRLAMPGRLSVPPVDEVLPVSLTAPPPYDAVAAGAASTTAPQAAQTEAPPAAEPEPEVAVTTGRPAVVPAQRPASIAPPAEAAPAPEAAEPEAAAPEAAVPEATAAETAVPEAPAEVLADDTPRADPALAGARPEPRSARVRALGEALRVVPVEAPAPGDGAQDGADEQPARLDQGSLLPDLTPALAGASPPAGSSPAVRPAALVPVALAAPPQDDGVAEAQTQTAALAAPQTDSQNAALPPGGVDLSLLRPQRRPTDLVPDPAAVESQAEPDVAPDAVPETAPEAVARSLVPSARPRALAARVEAALEADRRRPAAATAAAPAPAATATAAAPNIPSSASVQQSATQARAIRTREANLIGVFGAPSNRRALVRMPNGQVVRLQVGDRFDGGQVSAIGDSELRYVRGGRDQVLRIANRG